MPDDEASFNTATRRPAESSEDYFAGVMTGSEAAVTPENPDLLALPVLGRRTTTVSPEIAAKLTSRSTLMALMGVAASVVMAKTEADCIDVGMAGLLHDSSLLLHPEWFGDVGGLNGNTKFPSQFRNHSIESAEILTGVDGIREQVLTIISQVHEQCDGSGYPNGLVASEIHHSAKILNTADAYLNLVQPCFHNNRFPPADALA